MQKSSKSLRDVLSEVLTDFNIRQEAHGASLLSDREYNGIRSMLLIALQRWITDELTEKESHFETVGDASAPDAIVERALISLVTRHGDRFDGGEFGTVVERTDIDKAIGIAASIHLNERGDAVITIDETI